MIVAVVGTRDPTPAQLDDVWRLMLSFPKGTVVVSGGARGIDAYAVLCAQALGLSVEVFRPEYDRYEGNLAPLIRNRKIAQRCDAMHAWPGPKSRGTYHAIEMARLLKRRVIEHRP